MPDTPRDQQDSTSLYEVLAEVTREKAPPGETQITLAKETIDRDRENSDTVRILDHD